MCLSNRKKNISKLLTNVLEDAIAGGAAKIVVKGLKFPETLRSQKTRN